MVPQRSTAENTGIEVAMKPSLRAVLLISFITCTSAPAVFAQAEQSDRLAGTVTYRERMALPPTAWVDVRLEDVSRADSVAQIITRTRIPKPGQVPIRFNLDVSRVDINPRRRYAVRA